MEESDLSSTISMSDTESMPGLDEVEIEEMLTGSRTNVWIVVHKE